MQRAHVDIPVMFSLGWGSGGLFNMQFNIDQWHTHTLQKKIASSSVTWNPCWISLRPTYHGSSHLMFIISRAKMISWPSGKQRWQQKSLFELPMCKSLRRYARCMKQNGTKLSVTLRAPASNPAMNLPNQFLDFHPQEIWSHPQFCVFLNII